MTEPVPEPAETAETAEPIEQTMVDAALDELDAVEHLDPAEQVAAYERAQKALSQTLAAIDQS